MDKGRGDREGRGWSGSGAKTEQGNQCRREGDRVAMKGGKPTQHIILQPCFLPPQANTEPERK